MTTYIPTCKKNLKKERYVIRAHFHECPVAHNLYFPRPKSWGCYAKSSETHSLFERVSIVSWGAHPLAPNLKTPTRLTNASHLTSKTRCTSAKIFSLGPCHINSVHLKLPDVGFFKVGWENSACGEHKKNSSPIIWPNCLWLDIEWLQDKETLDDLKKHQNQLQWLRKGWPSENVSYAWPSGILLPCSLTVWQQCSCACWPPRIDSQCSFTVKHDSRTHHWKNIRAHIPLYNSTCRDGALFIVFCFSFLSC